MGPQYCWVTGGVAGLVLPVGLLCRLPSWAAFCASGLVPSGMAYPDPRMAAQPHKHKLILVLSLPLLCCSSLSCLADLPSLRSLHFTSAHPVDGHDARNGFSALTRLTWVSEWRCLTLPST